MNKAIITANLTRDPELTYSQSGTPICRLGLACNTKFKDRNEVLFIDCTVFGNTAGHCAEYLRKGRPVLVEGRIKRDEWEDKQTGAMKHRTGIIADRVEFLGSRDSAQSSNGSRAPYNNQSSSHQPPTNVGCPDPNHDDDVPF